MYTGPKVTNENLVFGYDTGYGVSDNHTSSRFSQGKPTTNTWNKNTHSWTSGDITATRNATPPVPPPLEVQGFEVYKLQSNDGALNQGIMGTSNVVDGVGGAYVHSVYCYLESGTTVTVGQHWHPWAYGSSQTPPIGEWVRLSQTVTNAVDNYGNVANAYRTNGIAYFTAPQYELGSYVSPHVDGTRSDTASLIDLTRTADIDVSNISFDSTGQPVWDGTDDRSDVTSHSAIEIVDNVSIEYVYKRLSTDPVLDVIANKYHGTGWELFCTTSNKFALAGRNGDGTYYSTSNGAYTIQNNQYYHLVAMKEGLSWRLYVNGELYASLTANSIGTWSNTGVLQIGGEGNGYFPHMELPVLKVYNRVLSTAEIKQNHKAYKNRFNI